MNINKGGNKNWHNHNNSREHAVPREGSRWSSNNDRFYHGLEQKIH